MSNDEEHAGDNTTTDDEDDEDNDSDHTEVDRAESNASRIRRSLERNSPRRNPSTNPYHDSKVKLYSCTYHYLAVYADGAVRGTQDRTDLHAHLELQSVIGSPGHLRIMGLLTRQYVAMNSKGKIYSTPNLEDENTVFIQKVKGLHYQTYLSAKHADHEWYLAVKKNGKMKNGKRSAMKQKAAQFLSVHRSQYFQDKL